jgi:hypothetical protein
LETAVHYLAIVVVIAFLFVYHGGWNGILALAVLGAISFGDAARRRGRYRTGRARSGARSDRHATFAGR